MEEEKTASRTCRLNNKLGLHARPASVLARKANEFEAEIRIALADGGEEVNAKSIMEIMMLAAECGAELHVTAKGEDAEEALDAIEQHLTNNFGEE